MWQVQDLSFFYIMNLYKLTLAILVATVLTSDILVATVVSPITIHYLTLRYKAHVILSARSAKKNER